jgi:hypothetical protein
MSEGFDNFETSPSAVPSNGGAVLSGITQYSLF